MKRTLGIIVGVLLSFAITAGGGVAHANPSGGWTAYGPVTNLGSDEFLGCHFLYDGEFANLNANLGASKASDEDFNWANAANDFRDAYNNQGGTLLVDGYLWAYSLGLDQEAQQGQSPNPTWEAAANALCSPITTVNGSATNECNNQECYDSTTDANGNPAGPGPYPVYRSGCTFNYSIDGDSWVTSHVDLNQLAILLSALYGMHVYYSPGTGSGASAYFHSGTPVRGAQGETLDQWVDNTTYGTIYHSDTTILASVTVPRLHTVIEHEAMLAFGSGEPEYSGTQEIMETDGGPNYYPQLGDWDSGALNGIYAAPC